MFQQKLAPSDFEQVMLVPVYYAFPWSSLARARTQIASLAVFLLQMNMPLR
jgi:hypothetical protein